MTTSEGQASCLWAMPAALPEGGLGTRDIARGAAGMLVGPAGFNYAACRPQIAVQNRSRACIVPTVTLAACHRSRRPACGPSRPGTLCVYGCLLPCDCALQLVVEHVRCRSGMRHGCLLSGNKRVLQVGGLQKVRCRRAGRVWAKGTTEGTVPTRNLV